jgi:hypothetical protein
MYIICAEDTSAHPPLRHLNVSNVVEIVYLFPFDSERSETATDGVPPPFHVIAAWARSPEDADDQEFHFQFSIVLSPEGPQFEMSKGVFRFGMDPLHRITLVGKLWAVGGPGICRVISRLWPAENESAVVEQVYSFVVAEPPPTLQDTPDQSASSPP